MEILVTVTHWGDTFAIQCLQGVKHLLCHALVFDIGVLLLHDFLNPFRGELTLSVLIVLNNTLLLGTFELLLKDFQRVARIALPFYLRKQMAFASQEKRMLEDLVVAALPFRLMKIVHVQLPDKWRKIVVLEVLRENFFAEKIRVFNYEAFAIRLCPPNYVLGLHDINDLIQLYQEWRHMIDWARTILWPKLIHQGDVLILGLKLIILTLCILVLRPI